MDFESPGRRGLEPSNYCDSLLFARVTYYKYSTREFTSEALYKSRPFVQCSRSWIGECSMCAVTISILNFKKGIDICTYGIHVL